MRRGRPTSGTWGRAGRRLAAVLARFGFAAATRLRSGLGRLTRPDDAAVARLEAIGDLRGALDEARSALVRRPRDPSGVAALVRLAAEWERWDEAAAALDALPAARRAHPTVVAAEAALLSARDDAAAALRLVDRHLASDPASRPLRAVRFTTLLELGRLDEAEAELGTELGSRTPDAERTRLLIRLAEARHDVEERHAQLQRHAAARPFDPGRRTTVLSSALRRIKLGVDPGGWSTQHQHEVDDLLAAHGDRPAVVRLGLQAAALTDDPERAERILAGAPPDWRHPFMTAGRTWTAQRRGRPVEELRELWWRLSSHNPIPQTRPCLPGELSPVGPPPPRSEPGDIVLFTVIRNERWRLRWFLHHYRALGVTRFIVVDNDSTDGGDQLLLREPDVHLLRTATSYALGRSGMVWVNELTRTYGADSWNLYVDVDEALILPAIGDGRLPATIRHLEDHGHEALAGWMVDMRAAPGTRSEQPDEEPDFIGRYPYLDPRVTVTGKLECPYFEAYGGSRAALSALPELTKTPLVRGGRGISFLMSSHRISPAAVSDARCALLHFKMVGDFRQQILTDLRENRRRPACRRRYVAYLEALDRPGGVEDDAQALVRYEAPSTLEGHGLLVRPQSPAAR